jgi:hypothetical protein
MSFLNQNYFNNFQVRNPIVKNPINRNVPLQLQKVRPATVNNSTGGVITTEQVSCAALRVAPSTTAAVYQLPSATQLIDLLGVENNGLPTPYYSNSVQQNDILILPVINTSTAFCVIAAGSATGLGWTDGSTGTVVIQGKAATEQGSFAQLVIDFNSVTSNTSGVTGTYLLYGMTGSSA